MTGVRDPAFWRRFSMAVHMDEEKTGNLQRPKRSHTPVATKELEHTDSWLERTRKKQRRAKVCGWVILITILFAAAGITAAALWFFKIGPFEGFK